MLYFLLLAFLAKADNKCRILALGGGSDKGAYTAGAIIGLIENLPSGQAHWDFVSGNGGGSFNGYILSQTAKGSEQTAATNLSNFWLDFTSSDFYQNWPGQLLQGLLLQSGLYDSSPLKNTINKQSKSQIQRFFQTGGTDLISGAYVVFNSTLPLSTVKEGVYASATSSGLFSYVQYGQYKLVSGSVKYAIDVYRGINYCVDKGFKTSDIIVDIALSDGKDLTKINADDYHSIQVLLRTLAILSYDQTMLVVNNINHDFANVDVRSVVFPSESIPDGLYPYDFSKQELENMVNLGIKDAKNEVQTILR